MTVRQERNDMMSPTEKPERETRNEQMGPRDQFVPQVEDESRPASQVLQEQLNRPNPENAAPLFVP